MELRTGWHVLVCFIAALARVNSIRKIVMGTSYLHACDIEKMIPIYLIVSGVLPLLFGTLMVLTLRCHKHDFDFTGPLGRVCLVLLWGLLTFIINTVWLICGSEWVYPNYWKLTSHHVTCSQKVTSNCVHGTCNMTFLKFAFSMVTTDWICFALVEIYLIICCISLRR